MNVLIVDDSRAMRMIVARTLRQTGVNVATIREAANGIEALDAVKAGTPDLILSDWNMPEMNGITFLQQLRAQGSQVPFGFVTSESTTGMKELALTSGAAFLLLKPFGPDEMRDAIKSAGVP